MKEILMLGKFMKDLIIAKVFRISSGECFVYDGITNRILTLNRSFDGKNDNEILEQLVSQGVLHTGGFESAEWSDSAEAVVEARGHKLRDLILQITRLCNLDCTYCIYSGKFKGMLPHFNESMSEETARKSIDFFAEHSDLSDECSVSLYGGESLLKFNLVRYAVEYAKKRLSGRKVKYLVSSNGTNFSSGVLEWLRENPDVKVVITLNGKYQDETRRTVDGKSSLSLIMKSLNEIKCDYSEIWENQIDFVVNAASFLQVPEIIQFYREEIKKKPHSINFIKIDGTDDPNIKKIISDYTDENDRVYKSMTEEFIHGNDEYLDILFKKDYEMISDRTILADNKTAYIGSCYPFMFRVFVRTDGSINMCERVSDSLNLGSVYQGYNEIETKRLYNGMRNFVNRNCLSCWAQRMCEFCYQKIVDENGNIIEKMPESFCEKSKESIKNNLAIFCEKTLIGDFG